MLIPTTIALAFFFGSLCRSVTVTPVSTDSQVLQYNEYRQENRFECGTGLQERREWRTPRTVAKGDYTRAVKCLQAHPALDPAMPEARTRFDEFQAYHIKEAERIHFFGQFLPWHKHYIRSYENAMRSKCEYKGSFPYWDWSKDVDVDKSISDSPVFDPVTGFGGNGVNSNSTYTLPQKNYTENPPPSLAASKMARSPTTPLTSVPET